MRRRGQEADRRERQARRAADRACGPSCLEPGHAGVPIERDGLRPEEVPGHQPQPFGGISLGGLTKLDDDDCGIVEQRTSPVSLRGLEQSATDLRGAARTQ